jgi:hypothetical protein
MKALVKKRDESLEKKALKRIQCEGKKKIGFAEI